MSRRLIGRIVGDRYIRFEDTDEEGAPSIKVRYGPERDDFFGGVAPSELKQLGNVELYRVADKLFSHRNDLGPNADRMREAYSTVIKEAKSRRATLHD